MSTNLYKTLGIPIIANPVSLFTRLRNPEHRALLISGLLLAVGEEK